MVQFSGKKVVFWTHGLYGNESKIKLAYRLIFYKIPDKILVYGVHAKNELTKNGFKDEDIYVINNSLDFEVQDKIYNSSVSLDRNGNNKRLIFIGRVEKNKKGMSERIWLPNFNKYGFNANIDT